MGKLSFSTYGTRGAASNWENEYASHLISSSFRQGFSSPRVLFHEELGARFVVRGDDWTLLGNDIALDWSTTIMQ